MVPTAFLRGVRERVLQRGACLLEDLAGVDQLGEVVLAGFEAVADGAHPGLELVQDGQRRFAGGQLLLDQADCHIGLQVAHRLGEGGECHEASLIG